MESHRIEISTEFITLDAFLKWVGVAESGGHAKALIASSAVQVNDEPETRRGRKLRPGDRICLIPEQATWVLVREGE